MPSWRVHGRYVRRLGDAPVAGSPVVIELTVRRFKCLSGRCPAVTFAEQIEGLTRPHARQTQVLRSMLTSIALCLAGRPGARLAATLGIRIAKDALLDLLRSVPQPSVGMVRFLGVDDFALRKGDSYATILVDLEARRPVDVLPGRDAEPLAAWLRRHPEVEVICRDRAGAYAEGARTGAPQAMQVADGWHLWRNVAEAVERTVGSHHGCIRAAFAEPPVIAEATGRNLVVPEQPEAVVVPFVPPDGRLDVMGRPRRLVARTAERYAAVQALLAEGKSLAAIGRTLRLDHSTVRRFARAGSLDELLVKATGRLSVLDEHKPYLHARWLDGCHDIPQLHEELRERGFTGSSQCVRFARQKFSGDSAGHPAVELVNGFMAHVIGDTGDDDANYPPSAQEKLCAIDSALARILSRAQESGESLLDQPHTLGLRSLRALAADDRDAFHSGLTALLLPHSALPGSGARPRSLLPLLPLALAALAYRSLGWAPAMDTDYLPRALVTGLETPGPRVGGLGRNRRPDAVAALAAGPVVIERPLLAQPLHPESEALFEQHTREAFTSVDGEPLAVWRLASALGDQEILFKTRASHSADVTDAQLANLRLASQLGAAVFRIALAEPGSAAEVTIDGRTLGYPASRGEDASPGHWQTATDFALITGVREALAPLVLTGPTYALKDGSAFTSYREALHDYLRGADPGPATERALRDCEKAKGWGFFPPPAVLFSQLVEGDEESFNLALADALGAHRDHYRVSDRADDCDAAINLDILALTCHARRRGWNIRVESPYLPQRLLQAAEPFSAVF